MPSDICNICIGLTGLAQEVQEIPILPDQTLGQKEKMHRASQMMLVNESCPVSLPLGDLNRLLSCIDANSCNRLHTHGQVEAVQLLKVYIFFKVL